MIVADVKNIHIAVNFSRMRKFILLLFSSWMIFAGSCSLKDLMLYGSDRDNIETSIHHVSKTILTGSSTSLAEVCSETLTDFAAFLIINPIHQLAKLPDVGLKALAFLILLLLLSASQTFIQQPPVLHRFHFRLYLQLKRIQIYA